jgi:Fe-S-cluster containining protein
VSGQAPQRYEDPIGKMWATAARQVGIAQASAKAAGDPVDGGKGADERIGQKLFDQLCRSLIEGHDSFANPAADATAPNWRDDACLRLQWVLCSQWNLHGWFAPTENLLGFWNSFDETVLDDKSDLSVRAASVALLRATRPPWAPTFAEALAETRERLRTDESNRVARVAHPAGAFAARADENKRCEQCAWVYTRGINYACRQVDSAITGPQHKNIEPQWPACERFEPALDCQTCGACCREAFQTVSVGAREPIRRTHPAMVLDHGTRQELRRTPTTSLDIIADTPAPTRCASLGGGDLVQLGTRTTVSDYACQIYQARPQSCRSFTAGSESCLVARRRVGMSR